MVTAPQMETLHDADGYMRQYFPNGAMLEADKSTGTVTVYTRNGDVVLTKENVKIYELTGIQDKAKAL